MSDDAHTHLDVPRSVRVAADWAWRLLVIGLAVVSVVWLLWTVRVLAVSVFVAVLVSALLQPVVRRLAPRLGRGFATAVVLVGSLLGLAGVAFLLARAISSQSTDLTSQFSDGLEDIRTWLEDTFGIGKTQMQQWIDQAVTVLKDNQQSLFSGVLSGATVAVEVLSGAAIALFSTVFLLWDGPRIFHWLVSLAPSRSQASVREVGLLSWLTLTGYVRGTVLVALVDGLLIGLAVGILGVPLAIPLGVLVFFGAFVPIVGATVTGFVAVVVALASRGPVTALLVLAAVILVQQVEGHVLQPLVMGRMVSLHPLGVVLAITAGSLLAGLLGAVVAVPVAAVLTTVLGYYGRRSRAAGALTPEATSATT